MKSLQLLLKMFLLLILLGLGTFFCWFWRIDYDTFTTLIVNMINRPSLLARIQNDLLPFHKFQLTQYLSLGFIIIYSISLPFLWKYTTSISKSILSSFIFIKHYFIHIANKLYTLSSHSFYLLIGLLLVQFGFNLYNILTTPIIYDEAWSYNYFINSSFITPFVAFHTSPLYLIIVHCIKYLPFIETTILLRLPALIFSTLFSLSIFIGIKDIFNTKTAFFSLIVWMFLAPIMMYSVFARSYIMVVGFSFILFYALYRSFHNGNHTQYNVTIILAGILGLYSSIGFVYPLALIMGWFGLMILSYKKWFLIKPFILNNLLIGIGSFVVYLPMILGSGIWLLSKNTETQALSLDDMINYFNRLGHFHLGHRVYGGYLLGGLFILNLIYLLLKKQYRPLNSFIFIILSSPFIFAIIQDFTLFPRMTIYMSIGILLLFGQVIYYSTFNKSYIISIGIVILFSIANSFNLYTDYPFFTWSKQKDSFSTKISTYLSQNNIKAYYSNDGYYKPLIEYHCNNLNHSIQGYLSDTNSIDYADFETKDFEVVIWDNEILKTTKLNTYKSLFKNKQTSVFIKRGN